MLCHPSPARRLLPGEGIIQLDRSGDHSSFSDLQFSFPIKVIAPSRHFGIDGLSCCYLLSYGGACAFSALTWTWVYRALQEDWSRGIASRSRCAFAEEAVS